MEKSRAVRSLTAKKHAFADLFLIAEILILNKQATTTSKCENAYLKQVFRQTLIFCAVCADFMLESITIAKFSLLRLLLYVA